MKNCILALPALLRASTFLAIASPSTFNPQDDLLAFPQYEVDFADDYVSEIEAQARLDKQLLAEANGVSDVDIHRPAPSDDRSSQAIEVTYEPMTLEGQRYLCSIPRIKEPEIKPGTNDTLSKADEEKELARAKDRGWELLSGMEGNCVYFLSGWWSYKFCYNDIVRQFHQLPPSAGIPTWPPKEDPAVPGFTLGKYVSLDNKERQDGNEDDGVARASEVGGKKEISEVGSPNNAMLVQKGDQRYLVQTLSGGTLCDLTRKGRKTEVQFHCNPHMPDRIHLIKETSTCDYLMVIQTPRLCQDVAFLPPKVDEPNPITCSLILAEDQIDDYKADMASILKASKAAASAAQKPYPPLRQIVGDIEVGAHNIVPRDVKLEKSAIVGGGKETYVDTIASSDGKLLSKEELKKYGLGEPGDVEELKKKLETLAQGDEWRLVVIDTPRGREYKGIIGANDDEDGNGEQEDKKQKKEKNGGEKKQKKKKKKKEEEEEKGEGEGSEEEYFKDEL